LRRSGSIEGEHGAARCHPSCPHHNGCRGLLCAHGPHPGRGRAPPPRRNRAGELPARARAWPTAPEAALT
jgi:hypothetical protein